MTRSKTFGGEKAKASWSNNGGALYAPIDVKCMTDTPSGLALDEGIPPVRIARAVVVKLYQCALEDVDAEIAVFVIKGVLDSQLRRFMLMSRTLSSAEVAEWLCLAMPLALRRASLTSIACAVQRVVDTICAELAAAAGDGWGGGVFVASPAKKALRGTAAASRAQSTAPDFGSPTAAGAPPRAETIIASPAFLDGARPAAGGPPSRAATPRSEHVAVVAPPNSVARAAPTASVAPAAPTGGPRTAFGPLAAVAHVSAASTRKRSPMAVAAAAAAGIPGLSTATDM